MKISTICLILIINFTQALIAQNTAEENTIMVKIVIPIIIEKIEETDYTDQMKDLYSLNETTWAIGINDFFSSMHEADENAMQIMSEFFNKQ